MIPELPARICQDFVAENEHILTSHSFEGNSIEHTAVRFIQRVAAGVQASGSDDIYAVLHGEEMKNGCL